MRSIRYGKCGIGVALMLTSMLASQALGQSLVQYELELGGDNNRASWKAGTRVAHVRGSNADGQIVFKGLDGVMNYAVVLKASGFHQQPGHPSNGLEISGAANVVFNVELVDEYNNLVTDAIFKSTINDGTGNDPLAASAFALGFINFATPGRLIDPLTSGGPRLEPIYTYPTAPPGSGKLIGQGAGYKEWNRTGANSIRTTPGVGMLTYPSASGAGGRRTGWGHVPVAEGQIDISSLTPGTYTLKVIPGNGNNVLRGDFDMFASTNRPAFAVAANQTAGDSITFEVREGSGCTAGIVGRYVFYNNSAWDTVSDDDAIAPDKTALLPGQGSSFANYISYSKGLNGIMIDACSFNRLPVWNEDVLMLIGNTADPFSWGNMPPAPTMVLRPGEGVNGSDRLVFTWPDNAIPNKTWLLIGLFAGDGSLGIPADDMFIFGVQIGDADGDGQVNANDEILARNNPRSIFNPAAIDDPHDFNRDKKVDALDQIIARNNPASVFNRLVAIPSW